jgi:hypothetical protein
MTKLNEDKFVLMKSVEMGKSEMGNLVWDQLTPRPPPPEKVNKTPIINYFS